MKINVLSLFIFAILFTFQSLFGQQITPNIVIDGVIKNKKDGKPVPFVHVINVTTKQGTTSNLQGRFTISIKKEDSLLFSAIGFERYTFSLKEGVETAKLSITIEMDTESMELEPVQIFAYRDERALKQAILELNIPVEPEKEVIQLPGFYYGPRKEVAATPLSNPLSYIYEKFGKRPREERKYKRLEEEHDTWRTQVLEKYNPALVKEITGLPEEQIEAFMEFCKMDNQFISVSSNYEIVVAINQCFDEYLVYINEMVEH